MMHLKRFQQKKSAYFIVCQCWFGENKKKNLTKHLQKCSWLPEFCVTVLH